MRTLRLYKRDILMSASWQLFFLIVPMIMGVVMCIECHNVIEHCITNNMIMPGETIVDYCLFCTRGSGIHIFDPKIPFSIPIHWFIFQICISYYIAYFSHDDYLENGRNLFISVRDKRSWWTSKCLWCISVVILYFIIFVITIIVTARCLGADWTMRHSDSFSQFFYGNEITKMTLSQEILASVVLPLLMTIALCLSQILVSFITTPIISFIITCSIYILSSCYTNWFMIGNYTMWLRSIYCTDQGVKPVSGLALAIGISLVVWILGRDYFERKDVF